MAIFTHVVLGANDLDASKAFYDAALSPLGVKNMGAMGNMILYGKDAPEFMVTKPLNGEPAHHANGGTLGFHAPSRAAVDQFHAGALSKGGACEGEPGPRPIMPNAYGAYVRDPAGNKLCAYTFAPE
jgi:catechol 2,3-dioxygenase-like lactoylglutathione lyase family enzyme